MPSLPQIKLGGDINYIAAYMTDTFDPLSESLAPVDNPGHAYFKTQLMPAGNWITALNRITPQNDPPVTIISGGPELHPEFYEIISAVRGELPLVFVTTLQFDINGFIQKTHPSRFTKIYAAYSPRNIKADDIVARSKTLTDAGFNITIAMGVSPSVALFEPEIRNKCESHGIDFNPYDLCVPGADAQTGKFKWDDCCGAATTKSVLCRTTGVLIAPDGNVFRCRSNLRNNADPIVHILSPFFPATKKFIPCGNFGRCHPNDVRPAAASNAPISMSVDIIFEAEQDVTE